MTALTFANCCDIPQALTGFTLRRPKPHLRHPDWRKAGITPGDDYPNPIVQHDIARKSTPESARQNAML